MSEASGGGKWSDLAARVGSGIAMVVVGLGAVAAGGHVFHLFVAILCGAMVWELVRMLNPEAPTQAMQLGVLSGVAAMAAIYLPMEFALPLLLAPALAGMGMVGPRRGLFLAFTCLVLMAGYEMMVVRDDFGFTWMLWLVLVVVVTDVAGYFAGRILGGPKFWPKVSPKKTWAGTCAGWAGAAAVGAVFAAVVPVGGAIVLISVAVSFASQLGDIAESAVKRRVGVKDSSALIPGHGGLLDRFDGMLGASVFVLLLSRVMTFPPETL